MYAATGIQFMQINSLVQLFAAQQSTPETLQAARSLLTIPDLFHFWLTGVAACEYTNATTTQMFDAKARDWARPLLERLGIPSHFLQPVIEPGTEVGKWHDVPVVVPACHDTGSAVAAINLGPKTAYISSGTWSLMGVELLQPLINEEARRLNFTNEGGVCGTTRFLKNIMGMWLLQSCRQQWLAEGRTYDYADLVALGKPAPSLTSLIDPDDACFFHPGNMPETIRTFCKKQASRRRTNRPNSFSASLRALRLNTGTFLNRFAALPE
ncbi:MAG: FGGY-family carbohydrate kinase [Bryobacteraceae bacterium]